MPDPSGADQPLTFNASPEPTVGVEMELWLLDPRTRELASRAGDFLERFGAEGFVKQELWQCMVEVITGVCHDVGEARRDLETSIGKLRSLGDELGVALLSSATHPFSDWRNQRVTPDPRYQRLLDIHRWPASRLLICGLHVHVGVDSGEKAIALVNSLSSYIPHLLALSSSSPFWHFRDTGLASSRSKIFEGLPKAGLPHYLVNWSQFLRLMRTLLNSGTIESIRDIWWDIRPHLGFGTVEIRVCDAPTTLSETMAIVALVQALVVYLGDRYDRGQSLPVLKGWTLKENKWRAIRHGLEAELIRNEQGEIVPLRNHLREVVDEIAPTAERLGAARELAFVDRILAVGNSASRQHRVYDATRDMRQVVDSLTRELRTDEMQRPGDEQNLPC